MAAAPIPAETELLKAIREEISDLKANIKKMEQWIVDTQSIKKLSGDQRANLEVWRAKLDRYEADLKEARAKEQTELARIQAGKCVLIELRCCDATFATVHSSTSVLLFELLSLVLIQPRFSVL
jgi:paraquat-inducible protein B